MSKVLGICDDRFQQVKQLFQQYLTSSKELGASLVINIDGENVVDLWGGYADISRTGPWEEDTISGWRCSSLRYWIRTDRQRYECRLDTGRADLLLGRIWRFGCYHGCRQEDDSLVRDEKDGECGSGELSYEAVRASSVHRLQCSVRVIQRDFQVLCVFHWTSCLDRAPIISSAKRWQMHLSLHKHITKRPATSEQ